MTARTEHKPRTKLEAAACAELLRQGVTHEHRSLRFRVVHPIGRATRFSPAIVVRRGSILFLIEPVGAVTRPTIARLARFLEQHSPEIILVILARDSSVAKVPRDAYDEIYPESELAQMTRRIRDQNPDGIVRPFDKP